jgi:hypothetical protein
VSHRYPIVADDDVDPGRVGPQRADGERSFTDVRAQDVVRVVVRTADEPVELFGCDGNRRR